MRDDQIRAGVANEVDDERLLGRIGGIDLAVAKVERPVLGAHDLRRAPGLLDPDRRDLLARVDEAAHVAGRRMGHDDLVPFTHVTREGSATEDLQIVGMSPDREHTHAALLP